LELAPDLDIVVCATRDKEIELLYQLGAREVVQPEFEASLELSAHLLAGMGLPLQAIEREVAQIRNSHYLDLRPERSASQVSREVYSAARDMNSKWYSLPEPSPLAGMTLEETDLRRLTGVTLMAIRRGSGEEIDYPNAGTILQGDDRLLLVGDSEELAAFEQLAKGEVAVPTGHSSCQWLTVPDSSNASGKTLSELDLRRLYGVQVQAIRREGKFIRFPHGDTSLLAGDCLLICGGFHSLIQVQQWIAPETQLPDLQVPVLNLNRQDAKFAKKEV
jgi:CPA2 family monovalent cation:H+ antiporter-2